MKSKKNAFTLIELLAIIVILAIIAVITVPIILNIIENSRLGAVKDSAYGYKDAINKYYVTDLSENPESNLKLSGTYIVQEDGTLKGMNVEEKTYTDNLEIPLSGTTPTGGYLNYENNTLKDGCLTIDEYKLTIENGEVKNTEKGKCNGMSLTACDSSNFHPSPENWFTFDETTNTITGFSESWDGTTDITIPCSINGKEVKEISGLAGRSLTSVVIGDSVKIIKEVAFAGNNLSFLIIGDGVEKIEESAFTSSNVSKLILGNNVQEIGDSAFNNNKLEKIVIPDSVIKIGERAFAYNNGSVNATISIGKNVKTIGIEAFNRSNLVGELTIPSSVESIGQSAFLSNNLSKIIIGNSVEEIGQYAFIKNSNTNENLTIINNKSGKAFDWGNIINGESGYNFETGTVVNSLGNVEVIK